MEWQIAWIQFSGVVVGAVVALLGTVVATIWNGKRERKRLATEWKHRWQQWNLELRRSQLDHQVSTIELYVRNQLAVARSLANPLDHPQAVIEQLHDVVWSYAGDGAQAQAYARLLQDQDLEAHLVDLEACFREAWTKQTASSEKLILEDLEKRAIDLAYCIAERLRTLRASLIEVPDNLMGSGDG